MQTIFNQYIYLILIIMMLVMIANKIRLAYPIVLVLGGLILSFIAENFRIAIDPELVFTVFLPPLLYQAAWQTSWKEFWKWRRVITSFAFPIVIFTSCVVAWVSSTLIPGFTLALGFLLGGIVSPPDAISATTIMRQVKAPKSLVTIVEGESLLNDATSLIVFRFALAAVITGQFHFKEAISSFFLVVIMGIIIGFLVGFIFYSIYKWLPTTPSIQIVMTLITSYCMYFTAEHFHYSGVLAVVSGGLFLSSQRQHLLSYQSRIQSGVVCSTIGFVLNGLIFMLIGLQLPSITQQLNDIDISWAIAYGLLISVVLILTRLLCTFGASVFTRFMSHFITVADTNPGWKTPMIFGWAGMRGVVSLAAALSIPLFIRDGEPFPYRNLILFIAFIVILSTLVLQGLTLPWLIRKVNLKDRFTTIPFDKQETIIQNEITQASLLFLKEKNNEEQEVNLHIKNLLAKFEIEIDIFQKRMEVLNSSSDEARRKFQNIYLDMLEHQRKKLNEMNHRTEIDEELIRKYLSIVDLEELNLRRKQSQEMDVE